MRATDKVYVYKQTYVVNVYICFKIPSVEGIQTDHNLKGHWGHIL